MRRPSLDADILSAQLKPRRAVKPRACSTKSGRALSRRVVSIDRLNLLGFVRGTANPLGAAEARKYKHGGCKGWLEHQGHVHGSSRAALLAWLSCLFVFLSPSESTTNANAPPVVHDKTKKMNHHSLSLPTLVSLLVPRSIRDSRTKRKLKTGSTLTMSLRIKYYHTQYPAPRLPGSGVRTRTEERSRIHESARSADDFNVSPRQRRESLHAAALSRTHRLPFRERWSRWVFFFLFFLVVMVHE